MIVFFIADSELSKATNINHGFLEKLEEKAVGFFLHSIVVMVQMMIRKRSYKISILLNLP